MLCGTTVRPMKLYRRTLRQLERNCRKKGLEVDFQVYCNHPQVVTRLVCATKQIIVAPTPVKCQGLQIAV